VTEIAEPLPGVIDPLPDDAPTAGQHAGRGYGFYLVAACLFALNGTVVKAMLMAGLEATDLSQLRATGSFLLLLGFVALTNRGALRIRRGELPLLLVYGVVGIAFTQFLYFVSLQTIPIGISLLIEFTAPLLVAVWFRFGYGYPTKRIVWAALAAAMVGLSIVGQVWSGMTLDPFGVLAAFGASLSLAFFYVAGDRQVRGPSRRDPVSLTMWGMGFAALFWAIVQPVWDFPFAVIGGSIQVVGDSGPVVPVVLPTAYMVVLGTLVPFSLSVLSMQYLRASQVSVMGMTEPIIATAIAWLVLGQTLEPAQIVGAAIVLGAVLVAELNR
jgi:drug/metabolite transporter (DMT)-like permease